VIIEGKRYGPVSYRVNQAVKHYQVDFWGTTPEGVFYKAQAIYEINDDQLWICGVGDNNRRPTRITSTAGSNTALVVARRKSR
jgi:hypothetical protein